MLSAYCINIQHVSKFSVPQARSTCKEIFNSIILQQLYRMQSYSAKMYKNKKKAYKLSYYRFKPVLTQITVCHKWYYNFILGKATFGTQCVWALKQGDKRTSSSSSSTLLTSQEFSWFSLKNHFLCTLLPKTSCIKSDYFLC